jgi:casein kinase 1|tara:strand:+ start:1131 stop:1991 length:861 start_codon:yes stop_codon:yes gene_type:complete
MENISVGHIIINKYEILSRIGNGKFGDIYSGKNMKTYTPIAIKFEKKNQQYKTLKNEATILKYLYDNSCKYIPIIYWYGTYTEHLTLIMPKYDCSLQDYILNHTLDSDQINCIMLSIISIISDVHKNYVLHRDIKPHHFMFKDKQLYLIDFGISTFYIDGDKKMIPNVNNNNIIGSSNYASYYLYQGNSYARRDDMISIAYIYIFMNYLELPWEKLAVENNNVHIPLHNITHPKNIHCQQLKSLTNILSVDKQKSTYFDLFMTKCYSIEYYEIPPYIEFITMFHTE